MLKQLFVLGMLVLVLSGCSDDVSNQQTIADLEENLDKATKRLVEKEKELKTLYQQLEGAVEQDDIKIAKDDVPKLWDAPDIQLWSYMADSSFAKENGWKHASTTWRKLDAEFDKVNASPHQTGQSPGLLLVALITDLKVSESLGQEVWEVNSRIEFIDENNAIGYIMSYGFSDDSVAGSDIKVTMKKDNGFWYIETAEEREQCYRGLGNNKELSL
jgi:hypothetical protein